MPEAGEPICELLPDAVPPPGERDTAVQGCAAAYTAVQGCAAAYTPRYTRACCTAMFSPSLCLPLRHHGADRVCLSSAGRPRTPSSNHIPCMLYMPLVAHLVHSAHLCTQHTCVLSTPVYTSGFAITAVLRAARVWVGGREMMTPGGRMPPRPRMTLSELGDRGGGGGGGGGGECL